MPNSEFTPPKPGSYHPPDLNALGDEGFERLSLDIAKAELDGVRCGDLHEFKGVAQNGVDFLVDCGDGGLVAGSCRSDANPSRDRIVSAAKEFVESWETTWKLQGVTHFILCLACEARTSARKKAIADAENLVTALGVTCETWSLNTLVGYLRGLPGIVTQHMTPEWTHRLCAPDPLVGGDTAVLKVEALRMQIAAFEASQAPLIQAKIANLQTLARQGAVSQAVSEAEALLADTDFWTVVSPEQQAIVLRTTVLKAWPSSMDLLQARTRRASELFPPTDRYFDLSLTFHNEGPEVALSALGTPRTARERIFKAALEIETGNAAGAVKTLEVSLDDSNESSWRNRILAIALAKLDRFDEAIDAAETAVVKEPDNWAALTTRAQLIYNAAMSPALGFLGLRWPQPFPPTFIKQDQISLQRRDRAVDLLQDLYTRALEQDDRENLSVWLTADMLNSKDGEARASEYYQAGLDKGEFSPGSVHWMKLRGAAFDEAMTVNALKGRIDKDPSDLEAAGALLMLYQTTRDCAAASDLINQVADPLKCYAPEQFTQMEAIVDELKRPMPGKSLVVLTEVDDHQLAALLANPSVDPIMAYEAARALVQNQVWHPILAAESFLLDTVATASAFELLLHAKTQTEPGAPTLDLILANKERFYAGDLPFEVECIRIDALANAGDLPLAISAAEVAFQVPGDPNYLRRAFYLLRTGNGRGAAKIVRDAHQAANPEIDDAPTSMQWAHTLHRDDPALAADLTRHAFDKDRTEAINHGAAFLAMDLFPEEAQPYMVHMHDVAAANPEGPIRLADFEQTKALLISSLKRATSTNELYEKGQVFGHGVLRDQIALHYLTPFESGAPYGPVHPQISHAVGGAPQDISFKRIVMDVTAVLIADALNLWNAIEEARWLVSLPDGVTTALLEMERKAAPAQADHRQACQQVLGLVGENRIRIVKARPSGSFCLRFDGEATEESDISELDLNIDDIEAWKDERPLIFIDEGVAASIAHRDLLETLACSARICISNEQLAHLRGEERAAGNGAKVADRLRHLRTRLAVDIRDGRMTQLPGKAMDGEGDDVFTYVLRGVLTESEDETVAWIDDRFLNGHSQASMTPIIGVQTVLTSLVSAGTLDEKARRHHIRKLREGGFNHLLPTAEEVVDHLRRLSEGDKEAKADLSAAHRAFNRFALQMETVFGVPGRHVVPEVHAGFAQFMLADRVIQLILEDSLGSKNLDAQAMDWAMDHFRLDWRKGVPNETSLLLAETWYGSIILAFLAKAPLFDDARVEDVSFLFGHVFETRIAPALHAEPGALNRVCKRVGRMVAEFLFHNPDTIEEADSIPVEVELVKRFVNCCPEPLKSAVLADDTVRTHLGVTHGVSLGDRFFPEDRLWDAIDQLVAGENAVLQANDEASFKLSISSDGDLIAEAKDQKIDRFMIPEVFHPVSRERRRNFSERVERLGLDKVDAARLRRRFGRANSAKKREGILEELNETVEGRLRRLKDKSNGSGVSDEELAPPPLEGMGAWLGFGPGLDYTPHFAFTALAETHGAEVAIKRWSGVPIGFPDTAEVWFSNLPEAVATLVADRLVAVAQDVVANRNLLALFSLRNDLTEQQNSLVVRIEAEPLARRLAQLKFARAASNWMSVATPLLEDQKIVGLMGWAWAGRLISTIGPMGVNLEPLADFLLERSRADPKALPYMLRASDISDPGSLTEARYLSALANKLLAYAPQTFKKDQSKPLLKELTMNNGSLVPHIACFSWLGLPDRHGSWFGGAPTWTKVLLPELAPDIDRFAHKPKASLKEVFQAQPIELFTISTLGARSLSRSQIHALLREFKARIPTMDETELACTQSILCDLPSLTKTHRRSWRRRMQELLIHILKRIADGEERNTKLGAFLEKALVAGLRFHAEPWADIEADFHLFAHAVNEAHATRMAAFLSTALLVWPITERYRIQLIVANLHV